MHGSACVWLVFGYRLSTLFLNPSRSFSSDFFALVLSACIAVDMLRFVWLWFNSLFPPPFMLSMHYVSGGLTQHWATPQFLIMGNAYSARQPTKTRTTNHSNPAAVSCISLGCLSVHSSIDGSSQDTSCLVEKQNVIVKEKDQLFPFAYTPYPPIVLDKLEYENFLRQYPGLS